MDRSWRNSTDSPRGRGVHRISVLDIQHDLGTGGLRPHINRLGVRDDIRALRLGSADLV